MGNSVTGKKNSKTINEEDNKSKKITFYLTEKEHQNFIEYCDKNNINSSEFLRDYVNSLSNRDSKSDLEKALKGTKIAIDLNGETKELLKAKKDIETALKLI